MGERRGIYRGMCPIFNVYKHEVGYGGSTEVGLGVAGILWAGLCCRIMTKAWESSYGVKIVMEGNSRVDYRCVILFEPLR